MSGFQSPVPRPIHPQRGMTVASVQSVLSPGLPSAQTVELLRKTTRGPTGTIYFLVRVGSGREPRISWLPREKFRIPSQPAAVRLFCRFPHAEGVPENIWL